jgi:hypothetical protein
MAERRQFSMRATRFTNRSTGKRGTFRISVSVPQHKQEPKGATERALENAEKIFRSLVESGRLPRRK